MFRSFLFASFLFLFLFCFVFLLFPQRGFLLFVLGSSALVYYSFIYFSYATGYCSTSFPSIFLSVLFFFYSSVIIPLRHSSGMFFFICALCLVDMLVAVLYSCLSLNSSFGTTSGSHYFVTIKLLCCFLHFTSLVL